MKEIIINKRYKHVFQAKNGIPNESNLQFAKKTLLFDSLRERIDLVKDKSEYPKEDSVTIELSLEIAIIDLKRYNELLRIEHSFKSTQLN